MKGKLILLIALFSCLLNVVTSHRNREEHKKWNGSQKNPKGKRDHLPRQSEFSQFQHKESFGAEIEIKPVKIPPFENIHFTPNSYQNVPANNYYGQNQNGFRPRSHRYSTAAFYIALILVCVFTICVVFIFVRIVNKIIKCKRMRRLRRMERRALKEQLAKKVTHLSGCTCTCDKKPDEEYVNINESIIPYQSAIASQPAANSESSRQKVFFKVKPVRPTNPYPRLDELHNDLGTGLLSNSSKSKSKK
jgi:hypothetical protein